MCWLFQQLVGKENLFDIIPKFLVAENNQIIPAPAMFKMRWRTRFSPHSLISRSLQAKVDMSEALK